MLNNPESTHFCKHCFENIIIGQTQAAEGRQLRLPTQLTDEKQYLPANDPHFGPPQ